jgi:RND family efflux transporter MFP subunit
MHARLFCVVLLALTAAAMAADPKSPPPDVVVTRPVTREVTDFEEFVGRTEPSAQVELRARVSGYLADVLFKDGAEVKKGDVLFDIDPRPYRADLDKAEANLTLREAQFRQADAEAQRAKALLDKKSLSQEEFDKVVAARAQAEARLRMAKAGVEAARLTLDFTKVTAPISGRIGRRRLDAGNVVKADETHLATLVVAKPMYVYFDIGEQAAQRIAKAARGGKGKAAIRAAVGLAGEMGFPHEGQIDFVDNRSDPATGTVRVRAVLANADELLSPGQFVRVRVATGQPYQALLVPEAAVMAEGGRKFVYVVNEKEMVESRAVTLGSGQGDLRVVKGGLNETDRVITGGLQGVKPGKKVKPREAAPDKKEKQ